MSVTHCVPIGAFFAVSSLLTFRLALIGMMPAGDNTPVTQSVGHGSSTQSAPQPPPPAPMEMSAPTGTVPLEPMEMVHPDGMEASAQIFEEYEEFVLIRTTHYRQRYSRLFCDPAVLDQKVSAFMETLEMNFGPMSENFKIRLEKRRALMASRSGQHPQVTQQYSPVPPSNPPVIQVPPVVTHDVSADTVAAQAQLPKMAAPPPPAPMVKVFPGTQTVRPPPPPAPMAASPQAAELPNPFENLSGGCQWPTQPSMMFGPKGKGSSEVPKGKGKYFKGKEETPIVGKRPAPTLEDIDEEPKGKGKRLKGSAMVFTQSMKDALDLDKQFFAELEWDLRRRTHGIRTLAELADEHSKVSEHLAFWSSTLAHPLDPRDEVRIEEEWIRCVIRQMYVLRKTCFMDPRWRRYADLCISHSGHLMDPESRIVLWHSGGKPQPTNRAVLEGVMATGRTHAAVGRPRTHLVDPDQVDPEHVASTETHWPPPHLRVPDEIVTFRRSRDLDRQQCYVCTGYGHSGNKCPYLTAVYICTDIGQSLLRRANVAVPPGIRESSQPFVLALRLVLSYRWPLRMACVIAKGLVEDDTLEEELEDYGDYVDKKRMAEELGYPRDWEWTSWDKLFKRLITQRASYGLAPPTPRRDTRQDYVPDVIDTQQSADTYRNPQASRTVSTTGATSTRDSDYADLPMQGTHQTSEDTHMETQEENLPVQQESPDTQMDIQDQQSETHQETHEEAQQQQLETQLATQTSSTMAHSEEVVMEHRLKWMNLD